jgi:uncharacterized membrane protein
MSQGEEVDELTPIDRPLMRSDLNEIRQIVWSISQRQLNERRSQAVSMLVCFCCALICIGCAVAGVR